MLMAEILYRQRIVREIENQVMVMRRLFCSDQKWFHGISSEFNQYQEALCKQWNILKTKQEIEFKHLIDSGVDIHEIMMKAEHFANLAEGYGIFETYGIIPKEFENNLRKIRSISEG